MIYKIVASTDGGFLGLEFDSDLPIVLATYTFTPDKLRMFVSNGIWRLYNSNYSIDVIEI